MESARAHGRSSAWDDDIASPGGGQGAEGAEGAEGTTGKPPPLAVDATGRLEDSAGDVSDRFSDRFLSDGAARPPRWAAAPRFRRRDSEPA